MFVKGPVAGNRPLVILPAQVCDHFFLLCSWLRKQEIVFPHRGFLPQDWIKAWPDWRDQNVFIRRQPLPDQFFYIFDGLCRSHIYPQIISPYVSSYEAMLQVGKINISMVACDRICLHRERQSFGYQPSPPNSSPRDN